MNRKMKKLLLWVILLTSIVSVQAQQEAQYSQYMFNSLVINPAYAGYKEAFNLSLLHRNQWADVPGAPTTQSLVLDGTVKDDKIGLGLSVVNDKLGIQNQFTAYANAAYRLKVGESSRLAFGLAFGVGQFGINNTRATADDTGDPNIGTGRSSYIVPDARFGVHYSNDRFYAGVSAINLLAKAIDYSTATQSLVVNQGRHYFLTAGYLLDISDFLKYKPSFLLREDTKGPTNLDINNFFLLGEKVWLGASYRTSLKLWDKRGIQGNVSNNNAVIGMVEFFAGKSVRIGYAYDYSLYSIKGYDNGSHEFSLGLVIGGGKRNLTILSPRYF